MKEEKAEAKEKEILIVPELPQQTMKTAMDDKGNEYELMTIAEALNIMFKDIKDLKKGLL